MPVYELSTEESQRIDILKWIAIVFVVFIHAYTSDLVFAGSTLMVAQPVWLDFLEYAVSQVAARCGVPLFFLISAVLLFRKKRSYAATIRQKFSTLLIPYLFWNTLWILIFFLLQTLPFTAVYFSGNKTPIRDCDFWQWLGLYGIGSGYPQDYPLWFMRDLMAVTLFFPCIGFLAEKFPRALLGFSAAVILLPITFPFQEAICWTCTGACLVVLDVHMDRLNVVPLRIFSLLYFGILIGLTCLHISGIHNDFLLEGFNFLGILYWIAVSKAIFEHAKLRKVFLRLSQWTFLVYAAHEMTLSSLKKICFRILPNQPVISLFLFIGLPLFVIALCIVAGKIAKRFVPKFYLIITGGRG